MKTSTKKKPPQGSTKPAAKQPDKRKIAREVHTHGSRRADAPKDQSGKR